MGKCDGAGGGNRTHALTITGRLLWPLSYAGWGKFLWFLILFGLRLGSFSGREPASCAMKPQADFCSPGLMGGTPSSWRWQGGGLLRRCTRLRSTGPAWGRVHVVWRARGSIYGRDASSDVRSCSVMDSSGGSIIVMIYFPSGRCWMLA